MAWSSCSPSPLSVCTHMRPSALNVVASSHRAAQHLSHTPDPSNLRASVSLPHRHNDSAHLTSLTNLTSLTGNGEDGSQGAGTSPQIETEGNVAIITTNKTQWCPGTLCVGKWQKTHRSPASSLQIAGNVLVLITRLRLCVKTLFCPLC